MVSEGDHECPAMDVGESDEFKEVLVYPPVLENSFRY